MGLENSTDYFIQVVEPDWKDYACNPLDMRKAMHAALSHYHMAEWYWNDNSPSKSRVLSAEAAGAFIKKLKKKMPYFEILGDISNAYKHFRIERYEPETIDTNPLTEEQLPYPEALLSGASCAAGGPDKVLCVILKKGNPEQKLTFRYVLGRMTNLWAIMTREVNKDIQDVIDKIMKDSPLKLPRERE